MEGILLLTDDDKRVLQLIGNLPEESRSRVYSASQLLLPRLDIATVSEDLKDWGDTWSNIAANPFSLCFTSERHLTETEIIIRRFGLERLCRYSRTLNGYGRFPAMCKRLRGLNYDFQDSRLKDCLSEGAAYNSLVQGHDMTLLARLPKSISPTQYSNMKPKELESLSIVLRFARHEKSTVLDGLTTFVVAAFEQEKLEVEPRDNLDKPQLRFKYQNGQAKRQATSVQFEPPAKRHRNHNDGPSTTSVPLAQGTAHSGRIHHDITAAAVAGGVHANPTMMQQQDEAEFPTGVTSLPELDTRRIGSAGLYGNMAGPDIVGFEGNATSRQCSGDSSVEMSNPAIQLDVPVPLGFARQVSHDAFAPTGDPSVMLASTCKDTPPIQLLENTTDLQNIRGIQEPFSL